MSRHRRRLTTTKRILYGTLIVCAIYMAVIIAAWVILDRTDATGLAAVVAGPAAVIIGFYEWKAKAENLIKMGLKDKINTDEEEDYSE